MMFGELRNPGYSLIVRSISTRDLAAFNNTTNENMVAIIDGFLAKNYTSQKLYEKKLFQPSFYIDENGDRKPCYNVTKAGYIDYKDIVKKLDKKMKANEPELPGTVEVPVRAHINGDGELEENDATIIDRRKVNRKAFINQFLDTFNSIVIYLAMAVFLYWLWIA